MQISLLLLRVVNLGPKMFVLMVFFLGMDHEFLASLIDFVTVERGFEFGKAFSWLQAS